MCLEENQMSYKKTYLSAWLITVFILAFEPASAASRKAEIVKPPVVGNPVAGKITSQICQGCHGVTGNSESELIPKLAGQYQSYIVKQMQNYLTGVRSHELMNGAAAPLNEQDIADIAAYYASQPKMKGDGSAPNETGEKLYLKGNAAEKVMTCLFCHGEAGKGLAAEIGMYPVVGGQHKAYLLKQLRDFREDDRNNSPSVVMNKTVKGLSDSELEALAEYMSVQ